ncbi:MAG: hypothetical protein K9K78_05630 [Spirochaetales bacterium]|nr:hypothetical protein [Spirochaetales bacterium]
MLMPKGCGSAAGLKAYGRGSSQRPADQTDRIQGTKKHCGSIRMKPLQCSSLCRSRDFMKPYGI